MRIEQGARIIVENWIHAQPDDVIHFITDETKLREAEAFVYATKQIGAIPKLTVLPSDSVQAGDSIEEMRNIMREHEEDAYNDGLAVGREEGREEGRVRTIRQLLESGMSVDLIAQALNLTEEEKQKIYDHAKSLADHDRCLFLLLTADAYITKNCNTRYFLVF